MILVAENKNQIELIYLVGIYDCIVISIIKLNVEYYVLTILSFLGEHYMVGL